MQQHKSSNTDPWHLFLYSAPPITPSENGQIQRAMMEPIDIFSAVAGMKEGLLRGFEEPMIVVLYGTL